MFTSWNHTHFPQSKVMTQPVNHSGCQDQAVIRRWISDYLFKMQIYNCSVGAITNKNLGLLALKKKKKKKNLMVKFYLPCTNSYRTVTLKKRENRKPEFFSFLLNNPTTIKIKMSRKQSYYKISYKMSPTFCCCFL